MNLNIICDEKKYSYQHLQGIMLVNLNYIASELKLSHSEYRLLAVLIGYWNKEKRISFPKLENLSKTCRMSNSTIYKHLEKFKTLNLVIIVKSGNKNNYYLNENKLLHGSKEIFTPCSTPMINKKENRTYKKNKLYTPQDSHFLHQNITQHTNIPKEQNKGFKSHFKGNEKLKYIPVRGEGNEYLKERKNFKRDELSRQQITELLTPAARKILRR